MIDEAMYPWIGVEGLRRRELVDYLSRNLSAEKTVRYGPSLDSGDGEESVSDRAGTDGEVTRLVWRLGIPLSPFVIYINERSYANSTPARDIARPVIFMRNFDERQRMMSSCSRSCFGGLPEAHGDPILGLKSKTRDVSIRSRRRKREHWMDCGVVVIIITNSIYRKPPSPNDSRIPFRHLIKPPKVSQGFTGILSFHRNSVNPKKKNFDQKKKIHAINLAICNGS